MKVLALALPILVTFAGCKSKSHDAELLEAKTAGDAVCECTKIPASKWGECSKAPLQRWTAAKAALENVELDPKAKQDFTATVQSTEKCNAIGHEVWRLIGRKVAAPPAPAPVPPTPEAAPAEK